MKILFVTYRLPYPPFSGERLRVFQLLQLLLPNHEVWLISFTSSPEENKKAIELEKIGIKVQCIPLNTSLAKIKVFLSLFFFVNTPMQVAFYTNKSMRSCIAATIKKHDINIVYICLARMGQYLTPNSEAIHVLDYMDAFSEYYHSRSLIGKSIISRILDRIESRRLKKWESQLLSQYNLTTIISPYDAIKISQNFPPTVIPGHVDEYLDFQPRQHLLTSPSIIFFGEMSTYYSENAMTYTVEKILPKVWQVLPSARLYIVGSNPTQKIKELASEKIIVTGYVDDVREYVASADVSIAPLQMGSGLKYKIVQSMAMGVPVVCTSIANQGIQARHQEHLLIADTPEDFAEAIITLLKNFEKKQKIANNALQFVQEKFSGHSVIERLEQALNKVSNPNI